VLDFVDSSKLYIKRGDPDKKDHQMLALLDTEIGGFNCLANTEGHVRSKFVLETQGDKGCENTLEDRKSSTKIDTWTESEFMIANFKSVADIWSYDETMIDNVDLYARTVLNTNGARKCSGIDSLELELTATLLKDFKSNTAGRFGWMFYMFSSIMAVCLCFCCCSAYAMGRGSSSSGGAA
jgi:hypothetical protein